MSRAKSKVNIKRELSTFEESKLKEKIQNTIEKAFSSSFSCKVSDLVKHTEKRYFLDSNMQIKSIPASQFDIQKAMITDLFKTLPLQTTKCYIPITQFVEEFQIPYMKGIITEEEEKELLNQARRTDSSIEYEVEYLIEKNNLIGDTGAIMPFLGDNYYTISMPDSVMITIPREQWKGVERMLTLAYSFTMRSLYYQTGNYDPNSIIPDAKSYHAVDISTKPQMMEKSQPITFSSPGIRPQKTTYPRTVSPARPVKKPATKSEYMKFRDMLTLNKILTIFLILMLLPILGIFLWLEIMLGMEGSYGFFLVIMVGGGLMIGFVVYAIIQMFKVKS